MNPVAGARRIAARRLIARVNELERLGHPAARTNPNRDSRWFNSIDQTIDEQIAEDREKLVTRSVEMTQVNPHASGAIESRVAHEIGVGLACRPSISEEDGFSSEVAEEINSKLKWVCKHWSMHGVDRRRRQSLAAIQRVAQRTFATYGECFAYFGSAPYQGTIGLTVELINPMRIETPPEFYGDENVSMGIRYHSRTGQIVGYYVRKEPVSIHRRASFDYEFIERFTSTGQPQMTHVFDELIVGQSRGLPWLTAAMGFLKDLDDYHESELITKQVEACFSLIIKGGKDSVDPMDLAEQNSSETVDDQRLEDLYPGMVHYLNEGEEPTIVDPNRPGNNFAPFVEHTLRAGAAALNIPYEVLAKNFFRTTYSSGRLAMLDGQLGFRMRRQTLIEQMLTPLWFRIVDEAFFHGHMEGIVDATEYLIDRHRFESHSWGGITFGAIDPEKEADANATLLETGQTTLSEIQGSKDKDWVDVMVQRDAEIRKETMLRLEREAWEKELRNSLGLDPEESDDPESEDESANNPELQGAEA